MATHRFSDATLDYTLDTGKNRKQCCFSTQSLTYMESRPQLFRCFSSYPQDYIPFITVSAKQYQIIPYPMAFPYGNVMVLHFYQQQESSTTKTVHKVINKGLKAYV